MTKCQECKYGANIQMFFGSSYHFKQTIKKKNNKTITINYNKKELGCRMSQWNDKEDKCLSSNFSEFEKFKQI